MKRTGFKRRFQRPLRKADEPQDPLSLMKPAFASDKRRSVLASCAGMGNPITKTEPHRNRHLLDMARGKPCLFRLPGICNFDPATTVACHSNLGFHGKAGARKADDEYTAWGCFACHAWLDQGKADGVTKELVFIRAHLAQVYEWRAIAGSAAADPKDRAAAQWALDQLNATPVGPLESPL